MFHLSDSRAIFFTALVILATNGRAAEFHAPGLQRYAQITASGSILPGGRVIRPMGTQLETGPGPFGLVSNRRGLVATADIGYERFGITLMQHVKATWDVRHIWARTPGAKFAEAADPEWKGVFFGIAFENDRSLWISEGDSGRIRLLDSSSNVSQKVVNLNDGVWRNSFAADLTLDVTRRLLFVLDQANFRVAIVDAAKGRVLSSVKVGRMPFGIALAPDGKTAYVTNAGVFQYKTLPGNGVPFPPFGFPSPESLAALGDPNVRESNSVCVIDVRDPMHAAVTDWVRTGLPFDSRIAGGSAPAGVLTTGDRVYVSNTHDDSVTVIDAANRKVIAEIPLRVQGLDSFRGILPAGLAFDPVNKWLLVAEAGINAVGVIDTEKRMVVGHLPVGWLPTRVLVEGDRVYVANARGRGTGPNVRRPMLDYGEVPALHRGTVSTFILPAASELPGLTGTVYAANGFIPDLKASAALPEAVKHVVLIVKENRTFDEVFGDIAQAANGPVLGSPVLARFGMHGVADGRRERFSVQNAAITPNHHAIAQRWAFSDNFYADADVSVDGHHWLTGAYPDLLTQSGLLAAYGGQRHFVADDASPGRLLFAGSAASTHPEEQPEAGTLWHHLERNGVTFRNFGEGFELAGVVEDKDEEPTGARLRTDMPMPDPLYRNTSRNYPGFNMNIPDQYRADRFIAEIEERYGKTGEPLPQFIYIHLPDDHMADERAADGYPYQASFVEDNDLALGRILEYLSHSPWWREMAVFVTEDDAQGGLDHIDSHRTLLMAAGPWVKRNYATHTNSSFPGLLKTVFELLKMPPLNLFDATASSLRDVFSTEADYSPYTAQLPDQRVFDAGRVRVGNAPAVRMDAPQ